MPLRLQRYRCPSVVGTLLLGLVLVTPAATSAQSWGGSGDVVPSPQLSDARFPTSPTPFGSWSRSGMGDRAGLPPSPLRSVAPHWSAGATDPLVRQAADDGLSWKRGMVIGAVAGMLLGVLAHTVVDAAPCDTCSGTGSSSAAEGTLPEFVLGFGLAGGMIGALAGAVF